jgi:Phage tail tube protein
MAQRIAGIAFVTVDGNQMALRGNLTVSPSAVERTMLAGQDGVHGYQEMPRVPYISGDFSTLPGMRLEDLDGQVDVTVVASLANGMIYSLTEGVCTAGLEPNAADGQVTVRWDGTTCEEITI